MCSLLAAFGFLSASPALGETCQGQACLVEDEQVAWLQSSIAQAKDIDIDVTDEGKGRGKVPVMPLVPDFGDIIPGSEVVPPVSRQYVSSNLSLVPRRSADFNSTLASLQQDPGEKVFGDQNFTQNAFGGIFTYDVYKAEVTTTLYGLRQNISDDPYAYVNQWFGDSFYNPTTSQPLTWAEYSNDIVATCWNYTVAIQCTFKAGTTFMVGSGAWRDTSIENMCDFKPGTGPSEDQKIITPQTPAPSIMQYIVDPKGSQADCCVAPAEQRNLPASFQKGCEPVDLNVVAEGPHVSERDYVPR